MADPYAGIARPVEDDPYAGIARPVEPRPKMDRGSAALLNFTDGLYFGLNDEASGAMDAAGAFLTGKDPKAAYDRKVAAVRGYTKQARQDRPLTSTVAGVSGALSTGGPSIAKLPLMARAGAAGGIGAAQGGIAGYGSGETPEERLRKAKEGAALGGALGPAAVLGGKALEPLIAPTINKVSQGFKNLFSKDMNYTVPTPDSFALVGPPVGVKPPSGGRPAPKKPRPSDTVVKLAERSGGAQEVAARAAEYRAGGVKPLVAQGAGKAGVRRLDTLAGASGKTADEAERVIGARRAGQSKRITGAVDEAFGDQTRTAARQGIDDAYEAMAPEYNEMLARTVIPKNKADAIGAVWAKIPEREQKTAMDAAKRIADYDFGKGGFDKMPAAQQLHYLKIAIGQRIGGMGREGTEGVERQRLTVALKNFRGELENAIPGYKDLNARWADNIQTEEALSWVDDLFGGGAKKLRPEEAKAVFDRWPQGQKDAALVGIRARILNDVEGRAKTGERSANIAEPMLNETTEQRLRVVLGDKAEPLLRTLKAESKDFTTLGKVNTGSQTYERGMDAVDQWSASKLTSAAIRALVNPKLEADRDKLGAELLSELTPEMEDALVTLLKRRADARALTREGAAKAGGAAARMGASQ